MVKAPLEALTKPLTLLRNSKSSRCSACPGQWLRCVRTLLGAGEAPCRSKLERVDEQGTEREKTGGSQQLIGSGYRHTGAGTRPLGGSLYNERRCIAARSIPYYQSTMLEAR